MKKFSIILVVIIALVFTSCTKEEVPITDLVGSWKLVELNVETPIDLNGDGVLNDNILDEISLIQATLSFEGNDKGSLSYNSGVSISAENVDGKIHYGVSSSISSDDKPMQFSYNHLEGLVTIQGDITYNNIGLEQSQLTFEGNVLKMKVSNGFLIKEVITNEVAINQSLEYVFVK